MAKTQIVFDYNGKKHAAETEDILVSLKEIPLSPREVKTRATLSFTRNGNVFNKFLNVIQFRKLLARDIDKVLLSSFIEKVLG